MSADVSSSRPRANNGEPAAGLVDWHSHMLSDRLTPRPSAVGAWPGIRSRAGVYELTLAGDLYRQIDERTFRAEQRLSDMDEMGVAVQVLSPPPYVVGFAGPPAETASLAAQQNEFLAGVVAREPTRFAMLAMLPYGDASAVEAEIGRLAGYQGVLGVCVTAFRDDHLCDPAHEQLWRQLAEAGLLAFVHPADTHIPECELSTGSVFGAGMPLATARTATRMIASGLLAAVPDLQVLLAHAGGALPSTIDRLAQGWRLGQLPALAESPVSYARRSFWADNLAYAAAPLQLAALTFGVERIVYGSDYPFAAAQSPQQLDALDPAAGLVDQARATGSRLLDRTLERRGVGGSS
jgi:aminocarboxymuconate-semialdehyde decarboxylase